MLKGLELSKRERKLIDALLRTFRHLEERIRETNALVDRLYDNLPSARLIHAVPGFGRFLSVLMVVEIADVNRFEDVGKFHAYAGGDSLDAQFRGKGISWKDC